MRFLQKKIEKLLNELDFYIKVQVDSVKLYCGGCVFVAGVIAEECKKRRLKYQLFSYSSNKSMCIRKLCKTGELYHMGISVENYYIAPDKHSLNEHEQKYFRCIKTYLKPKEIKKLYKSGNWHHWYNPKNNNRIEKDIKTIFKEYTK